DRCLSLPLLPGAALSRDQSAGLSDHPFLHGTSRRHIGVVEFVLRLVEVPAKLRESQPHLVRCLRDHAVTASTDSNRSRAAAPCCGTTPFPRAFNCWLRVSPMAGSVTWPAGKPMRNSTNSGDKRGLPFGPGSVGAGAALQRTRSHRSIASAYSPHLYATSFGKD